MHVDHECDKDEECNDNNQKTSDRCSGYPRKCQNNPITICETDEDCNDSNECTTDKCTNNDCFNERIEGCNIDTRNVYERQFDELKGGLPTTKDSADTENSEQGDISLWQKVINFFKRIF